MPLVDAKKRRDIMARSMKLGHCICSPKRPCPCDIFTVQGLCPCAGDRPDPIDIKQLKLTELVQNGGCASKIAPTDLEGFLSRLPDVDDPSVLSGLPAGDDAGVYQLSDDMALVQTVDVFTPCVDDPYTFGRICAANCLSDIYAMGAEPLNALSILAFPSETLDQEVMYQMMKGAMVGLNEAGCSLMGGHSIKDDEIKLGFSITGKIDPERAVSLDSAKVGDRLVLTKPLGIGVLTFAHQIGKSASPGLQQAVQSMTALNRDAAAAMMAVGVSACTDITGFGLFGHLIRMVRKSGSTARIHADALPSFDCTVELLDQGVIPGAIERNQEFIGDDLIMEAGVSKVQKLLGFDAQTSGGLLIFVPEDRHEHLIALLKKKGVTPHTIGEVVDTSAGKIELIQSSLETTAAPPTQTAFATRSAASLGDQPPSTPDEPHNTPHDSTCCADLVGDKEHIPNAHSTAPESMAAFGTLMQSVGSRGVLDERTKELITFALVLFARCDPCLDIHIEKALAMGITREALDEVAWCAIAMGGAPVKMFYTQFMESIDPPK